MSSIEERKLWFLQKILKPEASAFEDSGDLLRRDSAAAQAAQI